MTVKNEKIRQSECNLSGYVTGTYVPPVPSYVQYFRVVSKEPEHNLLTVRVTLEQC